MVRHKCRRYEQVSLSPLDSAESLRGQAAPGESTKHDSPSGSSSGLFSSVLHLQFLIVLPMSRYFIHLQASSMPVAHVLDHSSAIRSLLSVLRLSWRVCFQDHAILDSFP